MLLSSLILLMNQISSLRPTHLSRVMKSYSRIMLLSKIPIKKSIILNQKVNCKSQHEFFKDTFLFLCWKWRHSFEKVQVSAAHKIHKVWKHNLTLTLKYFINLWLRKKGRKREIEKVKREWGFIVEKGKEKETERKKATKFSFFKWIEVWLSGFEPQT